MLFEFTNTMRRMRGQIIGWSIGLSIYALMMVALFDSVTSIEGFDELIASYPPEIMAFFGEMQSLTTPAGYLDTYWFNYMSIIIGIFAVGAGAALIVGDEEKGFLDLVMAHPISRTALYWGRVLGFAAANAVILLVCWLAWAIPSGGTGLDLTWIEFLRPFLPLYAVLQVFSMLALLLSTLMPSARMAGWLTGALLVGNYLLMGMANINEDLKVYYDYTPLRYYQGGKAIHALDWEWLAGLLAASVILALLGWWRFQRRDIRVGGEGGWRLPAFITRGRPPVAAD